MTRQERTPISVKMWQDGKSTKEIAEFFRVSIKTIQLDLRPIREEEYQLAMKNLKESWEA